MQPSHPHLVQILDGLMASGDAVLQARAENMHFEERVQASRLERYERDYPPADASYSEWLESHKNYLEGSVYNLDVPETFLALNAEAALPAAVVSELGAEQVLVRVESLDYALTETKVGSLPELEQCLAVYSGDRRDDRVSQGDAKALLDEVCRSLNRSPNAVRPRFAAFAQDLQEDIDAGNWAERLRDRLGLAHLPPAGTSEPHPVALMCYKVGDVAKAAQSAGAAHALALPTPLDAEPYEVFHPSPREETYGRTLNLAGNEGCDQLASEVLHLRMDYLPKHIWKVGAITTRADMSPVKLAELRGQHLFCLQYLSGRGDFGRL